MGRMVFPIEEPDFETFCYDVETLTRDAINVVCEIFAPWMPTIDFETILAPLCEDAGMAMARIAAGE